MKGRNKVKLAEEYAIHYHEGQYRKGDNLPYHTHPIEVASILERYGYKDTITQCMARLHDVIEDTELITGEIKERFGYEIANGVFILSKNTINNDTRILLDKCLPIDINTLTDAQVYKLRLSFARKKIKRVKIADMIHNTRDLSTLTKPGSKEKKLADVDEFYGPMGRQVAAIMIKELEENIQNYRRSIAAHL